MPSMAGQPLPKETLGNWLGENLRADGLLLADQELLRAVNVDLHTTLGALTVRAGRTPLTPTVLSDAVRLLARHNGRRYQAAAGVLSRDGTSIFTALDTTTLHTTVAPYRPLLDTTTWTFLADQGTNAMLKDDGTTLSTWGIAAPAAAPTLGVGPVNINITGDYGAVYTYARYVDGQLAHESNPSPSPAAVSLIQFDLAVTVVASTDPQVTHINIYRTLADGTLYFFDQTVANTSGTYNSSQVDGDLGTKVEVDNDPPVPAYGVVEFQGHLFTYGDGDNPDYLWYSKRFRPESFPAEQFLKLGDPSDPLQAAVALTGMLGVFSRLTKYRVIGNAISGFTAMEALNSRGVVAPQAAIVTSRGALFVARDGLFLTNFAEQDVEISQDIQGLFAGQTINGLSPIDFDVPEALTLAEYKRRLYFGYQDTQGDRMLAVYSLDTRRWVHATSVAHRLAVEEDTDQLTMGATDGRLWVLESGTGDGGDVIAADVLTPPRAGGDRFQRKGYTWLGIDAIGNWHVSLLVDGTAMHEQGVAWGTRRTRFAPIPALTQGFSWQAQCTGTGTGSALYGLEVLQQTPYPGEVAVEDTSAPSVFLQVLPGSPVPLPLQRRRFQFLTLDADASATDTETGIWTADLYVDDALVASVEVPGTNNKMLHRLPVELTGYTWSVRARYSQTTVPMLHSLDVLDTGPPDGQVWVESFLDPDALVQLLPAQQQPAAMLRKRFAYVKWDAEAASGVWTLDVYIDNVLRHRLQIVGDRQRGLHRLPPNLQGFTWHIRARYSLASIPVVYGAQVLSHELQAA